jgi:hypothetical protein
MSYMSGEARVLNPYNYGSMAPTIKAMCDAETRRTQAPEANAPVAKAKTRQNIRTKAFSEARAIPGISVFAVLGSLFVATLMVFVVLAQISFNETAGEAVRLNNQLIVLAERQKALELAFERAIDIKEVERFARDELGMSRPDAGQVIIINTIPRDTATVFDVGEERGIKGFGTFLRSLTDYFR